MDLPLDDETLQRVYAWIDEIPLSRPKKSIARDFSDGILAAEVVAFYFPKLVQMHNYSAANSIKQKQYNWNTLNRAQKYRLTRSWSWKSHMLWVQSQGKCSRSFTSRCPRRISTTWCSANLALLNTCW
jgi:hypothetical protein